MDIFISYARGDREQVSKLASALQAEGLSVWWDHNLLAGDDYETLIDAQIKDARAVVVVWSDKSTGSHWVRSEADAGLQARKLLPLQFDKTRIPRPFDRLHTLDLSDWKGQPGDSIKPLINSAHAIARGNPPRLADHKLPKRRLISAGALASGALVAAAIIGNVSGLMGWGADGKGEAELTKRFETIDAKLDSVSTAMTRQGEPEIDQSAVRKILQELSAIGIAGDEAIYTLMQTGDLHDTIDILQSKYQALPLGATKRQRINLLHQIGALSMDVDPDRALATYSAVIDLNPNDALAQSYLTRIKLRIGGRTMASKARLMLTSADSHRTDSSRLMEEFLAAGIPGRQGRFEESLVALAKVREEATALGLGEIALHVEIDEITFRLAGKTATPEALIVELLSVQARAEHLANPDLEIRALSLLGGLQMLADNPKDAIETYEIYLERAKKLERLDAEFIGVSMLAKAHVQLEHYDIAASLLTLSISMARENATLQSNIGWQFAAFADLEYQRGENAQACLYIRRAITESELPAENILERYPQLNACTLG